MDEFLSTDNIMSGVEASALFGDDSDNTLEESAPIETKEDNQEQETTEIDPEDLFDDNSGQSESVGSEDKNTEEKKDTPDSNEDGTSPENNFYSSIANALRDEGIFPDLSDEDLENIKEPEDFRDLVSKQIQAGIEDVNKRVYEALNAGIQPSVVQQYEKTLNYLDNITPDMLSEENERGEQLRRQVLQQDFMNKGYSQERAVKMTERLFNSGEDIDESLLALLANKEFFGSKYQKLIEDAKAEEEQKELKAKKEAEQLKKDILNTDKVFGDYSVDKSIRQKIYDNISKPIFKDKETGQYYTALQKYRKDNELAFIKNVGILYTLTNGFTDLSLIAKPAAKKEVRSKLRELENTINNTHRTTSGQLKYVDSSNSGFSDSGFMIDIS